MLDRAQRLDCSRRLLGVVAALGVCGGFLWRVSQLEL